MDTQEYRHGHNGMEFAYVDGHFIRVGSKVFPEIYSKT